MNAQVFFKDVAGDVLLTEMIPDGHNLAAGELVLIVTQATKTLTPYANLSFTVGVIGPGLAIALVQDGSDHSVQWGFRSWVCCRVSHGEVVWGEVHSDGWSMSYSAFESMLSSMSGWMVRSMGQLYDRPTIEIGEELVLYWLSKALLRREEKDLSEEVIERLGYVSRFY